MILSFKKMLASYLMLEFWLRKSIMIFFKKKLFSLFRLPPENKLKVIYIKLSPD